MTAKNHRKRQWTAAEDDELRRLYDTMPSSAVAVSLGRSKASIKNRVNKLGIMKGHNSGGFPLGNVPWNKGTHFTAGGRSAETRFRKGQLSGRALLLKQPVGALRINVDGYLERKINDDLPFIKRWRAEHLVLWEAVNGTLPAGHAVVFRDGDKTNIALENLECITRAELMRRNSHHNHGPEIAALVQLRGALSRQINRRTGNQESTP